MWSRVEGHCAACHAMAPRGENKIGTLLVGMVGNESGGSRARYLDQALLWQCTTASLRDEPEIAGPATAQSRERQRCDIPSEPL
jgi:cytochrome c2